MKAFVIYERVRAKVKEYLKRAQTKKGYMLSKTKQNPPKCISYPGHEFETEMRAEGLYHKHHVYHLSEKVFITLSSLSNVQTGQKEITSLQR